MGHKYIVLLGDGMADYPISELNNKTVLEYAHTPAMDSIAENGIIGTAVTVPNGMKPGSDTANLSIFGYNPQQYFTGRAPLEALNLGIELSENDVAFRCNFVTIENQLMKDFTADHIMTEFSEVLINTLNKQNFKNIEFHTGVSYRNCMIWRNYPYSEITITVPPHDIQNKNIIPYLPEGDGAEFLQNITDSSIEICKNNSDKSLKGTPTSVWLWGGGKKPSLDSFYQKFGISGVTISAVDLIHGIGIAAGLRPVKVEGATGYLDTNYGNKVTAAKKALETDDFVYLHVEAPDESGHEGDMNKKIKAIEDFDSKIVAPILSYLQTTLADYTVLVLPDHPTPVSIRTHTSDPVPFAALSSNKNFNSIAHIRQNSFNERAASRSGLVIDNASKLLDIIINNEIASLGD